MTNVDEIAYFKIVDWIKNDCGCQDVGRFCLERLIVVCSIVGKR